MDCSRDFLLVCRMGLAASLVILLLDVSPRATVLRQCVGLSGWFVNEAVVLNVRVAEISLSRNDVLFDDGATVGAPDVDEAGTGRLEVNEQIGVGCESAAEGRIVEFIDFE